MNGKKIIREFWIPVVAVFVISLFAVIFYRPYQKSQYEEHKKAVKEYLKKFNKKNLDYLNELRDKIKSLPVNAIFISSLQSEYLIDHTQGTKSQKYLWFSGMSDEFIFGVPQKAFQKLNDGFDKNSAIIQTDGFYANRNEFLLKLIDQYKEVDFSEFSKTEPERFSEYRWRFFNDEPEYKYDRPLATTYTAPVTDASGKILGTLYLKVVDQENKNYYLNENYFEDGNLYTSLFPFIVVLLVVSSLFIWFLMPTWVYIDAQQRGLANALTWAILTLIGIFFGLVIYLITRPSSIKTLNCPHCENELNGTRAYCPHCGYDLTSTYCQACEYPIKPEWKFCPSCRTETKLIQKNNHKKQIPENEDKLNE